VDCSRSRQDVHRPELKGNDKTVTKLGKNVYQTPEEAEADVKR